MEYYVCLLIKGGELFHQNMLKERFLQGIRDTQFLKQHNSTTAQYDTLTLTL